MRGLPSILSYFRIKVNKFNNTGARMLDSVYHRTFKFITKNRFFSVKMSTFCGLLQKLKWTPVRNVTESVNH